MLEDILILVPILLVLIMIFNIFIYALNYQRYKQSSYYRITRNPYFDILSDTGKSGEYSIYKKLKFLEKDRNKILFNLYIPRENNKFTEIESTVKNGAPVYLTKNGYGSMVVMSIEAYSKLTESIEDALDVADKMAEETNERYSHEEMFAKLREAVHE